VSYTSDKEKSKSNIIKYIIKKNICKDDLIKGLLNNNVINLDNLYYIITPYDDQKCKCTLRIYNNVYLFNDISRKEAINSIKKELVKNNMDINMLKELFYFDKISYEVVNRYNSKNLSFEICFK